jgi:hypothetical protein
MKKCPEYLIGEKQDFFQFALGIFTMELFCTKHILTKNVLLVYKNIFA